MMGTGLPQGWVGSSHGSPARRTISIQPPPTNLQLVPLDAAQAACRVAPGMLGTEDQLGLQQLVSAGGGDLLLHLLETLVVGLGLGPRRKERTTEVSVRHFSASSAQDDGRTRLGENPAARHQRLFPGFRAKDANWPASVIPARWTEGGQGTPHSVQLGGCPTRLGKQLKRWR